ncbi:hypothetical protein FG386_001878 [Cryptosporidium ryanae]|uniref:uncharacterized protein n=1 Tax=Cryptosporidium ryanae TaxID=515981 RepID=UPI00351A531C|nr:hypothetical protein FG386_001878 [Cryptosporidium ryanae]
MNIVKSKSNINYHNGKNKNKIIYDQKTRELAINKCNVNNKNYTDKSSVSIEVNEDSNNTYNRQLMLYKTQNSDNSFSLDTDNTPHGGCTNGGSLSYCCMTPLNGFVSQNNNNNISINSEYYLPVSSYSSDKSVSTKEVKEVLGKTISAKETRSTSVSTINTILSSPYSVYINSDDNVTGKSNLYQIVSNFSDYSGEYYGAEKAQFSVNRGKSETFDSRSLFPPTSTPYCIADQEINICSDNFQNTKERFDFEENLEYGMKNNMTNYESNICNNNNYCCLRIHQNTDNVKNINYSQGNPTFNQQQMVIGDNGTNFSPTNTQNTCISDFNVPSTMSYLSIQNSNISNSPTNGIEFSNDKLMSVNNNMIGLDFNNVPKFYEFYANNNSITNTNNSYLINSSSIASIGNNNFIYNYDDNINSNANDDNYSNNNSNIIFLTNQDGNFNYRNNVLLSTFSEKQNKFDNFSQIGEQQEFQNICYYQSNDALSPNYWDNSENIPYKTRTEKIQIIENEESNLNVQRVADIEGINKMRIGVKRIIENVLLENKDNSINNCENYGDNKIILRKKMINGKVRGRYRNGIIKESIYDELNEITAKKIRGMKGVVGKNVTGYINGANNSNGQGDRNFYIVDFILEIPLNIRELFMNIIKNTTDGLNILKNYSLGSLAMRRTGSLKPAIVKCFFNSYRDGTSRLQSKTKRQEGRPFIFVINETKLSRPWVFCPNIKCIRRSKSSGKLKGRIKIYEYCPENNKIILSPTFLKCARGFLTSDYYFCATLCPQQKYADHDSNFWGEDFITGFGGNKIQEALEKDYEAFSSASNSDVPLMDYVLFCNSKHQFVATFKRYSKLLFKNIDNCCDIIKNKQNILFTDEINSEYNITNRTASTTPASSFCVSTPNISEEPTAFATQLTCNSSHISPNTPCSKSSKYLNSCSNSAEEDVYGDDIELCLVKVMTTVIRNLEGSNEPVVYASTEKCSQEVVCIEDGVGSGIGEFQVNCSPLSLDVTSKNILNSETAETGNLESELMLSNCENVIVKNEINSVVGFNNYINNEGDHNYYMENKQKTTPLIFEQIQKLNCRPVQNVNNINNIELCNNNNASVHCEVKKDFDDGIVEFGNYLDENSNITSNVRLKNVLGTGKDNENAKNDGIVNILDTTRYNKSYSMQNYSDKNKRLIRSESESINLNNNNSCSNMYSESVLIEQSNQVDLQFPIEKNKQVINEEIAQIGDSNANCDNESQYSVKNKIICENTINESITGKKELEVVIGDVIKIGGDESINLNKNDTDIDIRRKKEQRLIGSEYFNFFRDPSTTTTESPTYNYYNSYYDQITPPPINKLNHSRDTNNISIGSINDNSSGIRCYDFSSSSNLSSYISSIGTIDVEDSYTNNKYETYSTGYTDEDSHSNYNDFNNFSNINNSDSQISFSFDPQDALLVESSTNWVLNILLNKNNYDSNNGNINKSSVNYNKTNNGENYYNNTVCCNCGINCDCNFNSSSDGISLHNNKTNSNIYSKSLNNTDKLSGVNSGSDD